MTFVRPISRSGMTLITSSLLSAPAANIDITNINSIYSHLQLILTGQTSDAATQLLNMRFNNDSGANYDVQGTRGQAAVASASEAMATTSVRIGALPSSSTASYPGMLNILIPNYSTSTFKKMFTSVGPFATGTGSGNLVYDSWFGVWRNTAVITQITLIPAAGNFVAGTIYSLYGLQ